MARGIPNPRTNDDASTGGYYTDAKPLQPDPSPEAVAAEQQVSEERHALEVQIEHRDREAAREAGLSYESWLELRPRDRANIIRDLALRDAAVNQAQADPPRSVELTPDHRSKTNAQFERMSRDLIDHGDRKSHVLMCDPPVEAVVDGKKQLFHPGVSRISVKQMAQKAAQGFSVNPRYPFLPKPTIRCEMASMPVGSMVGEPCPYAGYTDTDVDLHMKYTHPEEYRLRAERLARQREERQQRLLELLVERQVGQAAA